MAENTLLQEAIALLRNGDKTQARAILSRLIKADKKNPEYWLWMSAAVDNAKERIYCLETALQLDPENASAKRGLTLLGARPPDEEIPPFPLDRPRLWEEQLAQEIQKDEEKPRGIKALTGSPAMKLVGLIAGGILLCGAAAYGLLAPRKHQLARFPTITPGPSPTFTCTPTPLNAKPQGTPTFAGPTPLWALLPATYTPTPLYVNTPGSIQSHDYNTAAMSAYQRGDWKSVITSMEQIATLDPERADPYYYIGESYRFMGENSNALNAYRQALKIAPRFAPAYLGQARVIPLINPDANILSFLDNAIKYDENYAEAYQERAKYYLSKNQPEEALKDLAKARALSPDSALTYLYLAEAHLALGENDEALEAAQQAYSLDITLLDVYLVLGKTYEADGSWENAADVLETYTLYAPDDAEALALLGRAYYEMHDYEDAIDTFSEALQIRRSLSEAYLYRGLSYLALNDAAPAEKDLKTALLYKPNSFEASIALARVAVLKEHYGDCYLQVEHSRPLAESDEDWAEIYYWRATCNEGRKDFNAAVQDWEALLNLPTSATTASMRGTARTHLKSLYTPTPSPTPTQTPTPSPTATP